MSKGTIKKVAGPLVIAEGMRDANMYDVVRVSSQRLIGEIIEMHGDQASIQVYEETAGLGPGEPVESTEMPLSVELGPGLIASIYDGIQRPLDEIMKICGNNLQRGVEVPSLDRQKKWNFVPAAKVGDEVEAGDIIGTVQETSVVEQRIMVPYGVKGKIKEIKAGDFTVEETVASVETAGGIREISLSDASGMAYPTQVYSICTEMRRQYPQVDWWLHFHNTRGLGIANILAGMQAGFSQFDSSFAGVGGCPFVPGAAGNVATEDVVHLCEEAGVETGIDLDRVMEVGRRVAQLVGHSTDSYLLRAGKSKDLIRELPAGQIKNQTMK